MKHPVMYQLSVVFADSGETWGCWFSCCEYHDMERAIRYADRILEIAHGPNQTYDEIAVKLVRPSGDQAVGQ